MRKLTLLVVVLAVALRLPSAGGQTRVEVDLYTDCNFGQSDCPHEEPHPCLAGACAYIRIAVLNLPVGADTTSDNLVDWPQGLTVRAGTYADGIWTEVPGLVEALTLQRWSLHFLREQRRNKPNARDRGWIFQFTLPPDRVGQSLYFQAEYTFPGSGVYVSPLTAAMGRVLLSVVDPCSAADRDRIAGSFVRSANAGGDYVRAMALADSLIALGWRDPAGLESAAQSASLTHAWAKTLHYFDVAFKANGHVNVSDSVLTPKAARDRYLEMRAQIIERLNKQPQQR